MTGFLDTYWGMYLVQCLGHSMVAAVVADSSLLAWRITEPAMKQRIRLVIIIAPVAGFPLYQLINSERGSVYFRLGALLDLKRWLYMDVFGFFTIWGATLVIIGVTALIFLIQEAIPMIMHMLDTFRANRAAARNSKASGDAPALEAKSDPEPGSPPAVVHHSQLPALEGLELEGVDVVLVEDDGYVLFSTTGRSPEIYISRGIIDDFSGAELKAAVAHELGHIRRSRKPVLTAAYLLRVLQFFNPITLIEFRKVAQEEEKICDDMAIAMTADPSSLASAIERMRPDMEEMKTEDVDKNLMTMAVSIEAYSHDMLLRGRVNRLRRPVPDTRSGGGWPQFITVLAVVVVLNYFIV